MSGTVHFLRAPTSQRLRGAVDADLKGIATPSQIRELMSRDNLVPWLRILFTIEKDVENHIAKSRKSIAHLKPRSGQHQTPEWMAAKAQVDERTVGRLHILEKVRAKRVEVALLISSEGITPHTLGTVVDALVEVEGLLDQGSVSGAHDLLSSIIDRFEKDADA